MPESIRELVLYQKHDVAHERFGRDIAELVAAIRTVRRTKRPQTTAPARLWPAIAAGLLCVAGLGVGAAHYAGVPLPGFSSDDTGAAREKAAKERAAELDRLRAETATLRAAEQARLKAERERKKKAAAAGAAKRKATAKRKAKEEAAAAAERKAQQDRKRAEAEAKRKAKEEAEKKRLAMLAAEQERKRKAAEEAARRDPALSVKPGSGESFRDCPTCPEMVVVPAGSFTMGSPKSEKGRSNDEGPQHKVTFAVPFTVGKFEVTFQEWDACVDAGACNGHKPSDRGWGRGKRPVIYVSWDDAQAYAKWLSAKTGKTYRLLTEAEWEYSARAGTTTKYAFGDTISKSQAQFSKGRWGSAGKTVAAGSFKPNAFGLYDMHGNVWEWTEDCWNASYKGAPTDGAAWTTGSCNRRVVRGGSWYGIPDGLRSADRYGDYTGDRNDNFGFRLGRTLTP